VSEILSKGQKSDIFGIVLPASKVIIALDKILPFCLNVKFNHNEAYNCNDGEK